MTLPLVVILAFLLGSINDGGSGHKNGPLPAVKASAPPNVAAEAKPCTALLEALSPLTTLKALDQRVVETTTPTPYVVAWGDPAIVVRCGVDKPAAFGPTSTKQIFPGGNLSGAWYWVDSDGKANVYTAIDRTAYVSFTIPSKYQGADYLPILNAAVLKAMPKAVCSTSESELDTSKLCAFRKG